MASSSDHPEGFPDDVGRFIDDQELLPPGARVVVGVSGGTDSVALLSALATLAERPGRGYRLVVAHLNHRLRPEAAADADFVAALAERQGLPCVVESCDVAAEAERSGEGIEQAARRVRYDFLLRAALKREAGFVAVAHHADDAAETVLYRILRGTHLRGLAGIPVSRSLEGSSVRLVRPLLNMRKADIEAFCLRAGLAWRADSTNADTSYRRNFIRNELLPLVRRELNPRVDEALRRLSAGAAEVESLLQTLAADAMRRAVRPHGASGSLEAPETIVLDGPLLAAEHPVIRTYVCRAAMERIGIPMRAVGAEELAAVSALASAADGGRVQLAGGFSAWRNGQEILIGRPHEEESSHTAGEWQLVVLACPGRTILPDGREVLCEYAPFDAEEFERHCQGHPAGVEFLDADRVRGRLFCRARREGDGFVPLGGPGRQSVSDFLTNLKVSRPQRRDVLCVCDDLGIVFLSPFRIDDRVKASGHSRRLLRISVQSRRATSGR